jgi:hypothetical protein
MKKKHDIKNYRINVENLGTKKMIRWQTIKELIKNIDRETEKLKELASSGPLKHVY